MTRDELLPLALECCFGHCEVGTRMLELVNKCIGIERARAVNRCVELLDYKDLSAGAQACIEAIMWEEGR